jgi:hypothetical protein
MERDKAHALFLDALHDLPDQFIFDGLVLLVAPPDEDIGFLQEVVRDALVGIGQVGDHDVPAPERFPQALGDGRVDVLRVHVCRRGALGPDHDGPLGCRRRPGRGLEPLPKNQAARRRRTHPQKRPPPHVGHCRLLLLAKGSVSWAARPPTRSPGLPVQHDNGLPAAYKRVVTGMAPRQLRGGQEPYL